MTKTADYYFPWCRDDVDRQIVALIVSGLSIRAISREIELSYTPIRKRIKRINRNISEESQLVPSRFTGGRQRTWTDDQLIEAVAAGTTWSDCIRALGLSDTSAGNWKTVQRRAEELNLDFSHFQGKSVGRGGQRRPLEEILVKGSTYTTSGLKRKLLDAGLKEARCEGCNGAEWRGVPMPLEVEHVNGISNDHRVENLQLLCPNCHALTTTWRGRNIGKRNAA